MNFLKNGPEKFSSSKPSTALLKNVVGNNPIVDRCCNSLILDLVKSLVGNMSQRERERVEPVYTIMKQELASRKAKVDVNQSRGGFFNLFGIR